MCIDGETVWKKNFYNPKDDEEVVACGACAEQKATDMAKQITTVFKDVGDKIVCLI